MSLICISFFRAPSLNQTSLMPKTSHAKPCALTYNGIKLNKLLQFTSGFLQSWKTYCCHGNLAKNGKVIEIEKKIHGI